MVEIPAEKTPEELNWSESQHTDRWRDLVIGAAVFAVLLVFFISIDLFELLLEVTRDYEDWELDEFLALPLSRTATRS